MPRLTKTNGKELHAFKQEILESIEAKLSQIRDGMDYTASRMDGQARRMDSMAESYAKLERLLEPPSTHRVGTDWASSFRAARIPSSNCKAYRMVLDAGCFQFRCFSYRDQEGWR